MVPVPKKPEVMNLSGGILKIQTTDVFKELTTEEIVLDSNELIPDGTVFRVVSENLLISNDQIDWVRDVLVTSENGKVSISVKPDPVPGLYRITIYPITDEGADIVFPKNLNARFFIEIVPGIPSEIKTISAERFEDLAPYNGVKELNESWIVSANPDLITYLSVGPISDRFGNLISEGRIQLTVSEGQIVSENPAPIADGYAYFSYRPTTSMNDLTVSSVLVNVPNVNLIKNISMKLAKPVIEFLDTGNFADMFDGETRDIELRVKNTGSQPATNLNLNISQPFILLPEQADSCKERGALRSQEVCKVRIRYTRNINLGQNGYLQIIGQPSNFITSTSNTPLIVNNVEPARLVLSESVVGFPNTACGLKNTTEVYVTNTGSFPATNVNVTQPPSTVIGQAPYFKIILPNQDPSPDPNLETVINCGNTFPAGRKCRVILEFEPLSILPPNPVTGLINADSVPSLALSMSGVAVPGQPTGDIPIAFLKPGSLTPTTTMYAQNGQRTIVKIGPIADSCGNPVANGTVVGASVTGGTLNSLLTSTNNGMSEFTWNSLSKPELLGNQTITVTSNGYSKQATLTFQGVNLTLSGPTDLGQVIIEKPKDFTYTLRNTGNIRADDVNFTFTEPLVLVDLGTCAAGVSVNQVCSFTVGARPTQNLDYNASIFGGSSTPGINSPSINNILVVGRNKPVLTFDDTKYLFNDGLNTSTVNRTLTVRNNGPAISYNTVVYTESPYTVLTNNCPATLGVNQTCTVIIASPRNSAIGAGYKNVYIGNEVENNTAQVLVAYSELKFGTQSYKYKKYYCIGPFTISSVGINGIVTNLSSNTTITLGSQTGKVLFYSDNTCNNKITTTSISANTNTSTQFYLRSIAAEANEITGVSGAIPGASRDFIFEDIKNDILTFKPAIAIKNTSCILCHSNIKGNIVTNMAFTSTQRNFHGAAADGTGDYMEIGGSYWTGISNGSMAYGTSFIEGKIYVPQLILNTASRDYARAMVGANKPGNYDSATPSSTITTVADYLNAVLPHRTTSYINYLSTFSNPSGSFTKDARVNPRNISVRELRNVFIGYPSPNRITSFLDSLGTFKYYKWDDAVSYELSNFELRFGNYYGNIPGQVMDCDGDIFVDGPVYLKDLQLRTLTGCRIYATGTVFIEGPSGSAKRLGFVFIDQQPTSNLQVTSSKGALMGMSVASIAARKGHDAAYYGPLLSSMDADVAKIKNSAGTNLLQDGADSGNRQVDFQGILINAPRVDSRYTGDFKGVVIAEHSIWSLGKFSYFYDNVFDSSPILPFFTPDVFFSVEDCITNNIDQSVIKDSQTDYRSCYP